MSDIYPGICRHPMRQQISEQNGIERWWCVTCDHTWLVPAIPSKARYREDRVPYSSAHRNSRH